MKRFTYFLSMFFLTSLMFGTTLSAQTPGETCVNPLVVTTLPFNDAGNTSAYGNNYSSADMPTLAPNAITNGSSSSYLGGDDVVYAYTPLNDEIITISVTDVGSWTGLYAFSGCPFASTVGSHTSSSAGSRLIPDLPVVAGTTYYFVISTFPTPQSTNYSIQITKLINCSGTPDAGTINGPNEICASQQFQISMNNPLTEEGISYQWQSSPAGASAWADITNATNTSYSVATGITTATDYRMVVTCQNSNSSANSDVITVDIETGMGCLYCIPEGTNSSRFINNFTTTGGIQNIDNNNSGFSTGGYGDFTNLIVSQEATGTVNFTADYVSGQTCGFRIWVDWNQDGVFDETTEVAYQSSSYLGTHSGSFDVPANALSGPTRMRIVGHYLNSSGNVSPCATGFTYGEFEDYTFNVIALDNCTGTPDAGTIASSFDICAGTAFDISTSGVSDPADGLIGQWESSPAGANNWTAIAGATSASYNVAAGVTAATDYRYVLTCTHSNETDISGVLAVDLLPGNQCYCTPVYTSGCAVSNSARINSITTSLGVTNISNTDTECSSGAIGYTDYSATHSTSAIQGSPMDVAVEITGWSAQVKIWVDWNQNGVFDANELVSATTTAVSNGSTYQAYFEVPFSALVGATKMRVRAVENSTTFGACSSQGYGEAEDYEFVVIQGAICSGTPDAGTIASSFDICAGTAFDISTSGSTDPADGLVGQWESSPAGANNWTPIAGATSASYSVAAGVTAATDYRYVLTCTHSNETDISGVLAVDLLPASGCYCIPEGTNSSRFINNFTTTGGFQNIINNGSGFSPGGYGDFTNMTVSQEATGSVSFTANIQGGTAGFRIWVDWNQDGIFDETTEVAYQSSSYLSTQNGSFNVPGNALSGPTRMRIVSHWGSLAGNVPACETGFSNGEFEDYTFNVIALDNCTGTPDAGTIASSFDICAGTAFDISTSGVSDPADGLVGQWESSPTGANNWTPIAGATSASYNIAAGVTAATDYRYVLTCTHSNETDISGVLAVTLSPGNECYCTPVGSGNNTDEIRNFTLSNLDNDSGPSEGTNGYADYTQSVTPASLEAGETYVASLTAGAGTGNHGAAIWIDYNNNGVFEASEMVAFIGNTISANSTVDFPPFVVENSVGNHRLRVQYAWNKSGDGLDPCVINNGLPEFSETEDYMVFVSSPLPVKLASFEVEKQGRTAVLDWSTVSEENNRGFEIEHSVEGKNWNKIGFTATQADHGNSSATLNYQFIDGSPIKGNNFYRLKQVDLDGKTDYSSIRQVIFDDAKTGIKVYPNPAKDYVVIEGLTSNTNIEIINAVGQVVYKETGQTSKMNLKINQLPAGMYYIHILQDGQALKVEKVMITK